MSLSPKRVQIYIMLNRIIIFCLRNCFTIIIFRIFFKIKKNKYDLLWCKLVFLYIFVVLVTN